ncbi:hypothetical protein E4U60_000315 [Claviceps pazoutovae]|uniref:Asl1-like glycosyl hydrolase catalytic domain-containing protein n=1 Tax=Claviceps pazoutovae TaxID=1649127 RepID=A0A9P7SHJ6_9HYPO|nr:hypothetical protein E4U60_000315 [Claviceps pazoutovae]
MKWLRRLFVVLVWASFLALSTARWRRPVMPPSPGKEVTPNGKKAGAAGVLSYPFFKDHVGWWYDKSPNPPGNDGSTGMEGPLAIPMLYGPGSSDAQDEQWLEYWKSRIGPMPPFALSMHRPDRNASLLPYVIMPQKAAQIWKHYLAELGKKGTSLGAPAVMASSDEWWLNEFRHMKLECDWAFTAIHIYEPDLDAVKHHIDRYFFWYAKAIWVTEFGCRHDPARSFEFTGSPCEDQAYVNRLIRDMVDYFEADIRVAAYAYPDLNEHCALCAAIDEHNHTLIESGQTYLDAISKYG